MNAKNYNHSLVDLNDIIGNLASDYGIPYLLFDDLVTLGQYAVRTFKYEKFGKRITFEELCMLIVAYIEMPFGKAQLKRLLLKIEGDYNA